MENRILIDTNVLLDYLLTREPFYEDAKEIVHACVKAYNAEYIITRNLTDYTASEVKAILPKDFLRL